MYTLYSKPGSCSMAVHTVINELGIDVNIEPYQIDGKTNPKLAKINPRGNVPVIEKGDFNMREGGAILAWLCDEHKSELLPASGEKRAEALQWLMFANATMHPAYARVFFLKAAADADRKMLMEKATDIIQKLWDELDEHLDGKDYVCGDSISVGDILLTVIANWSTMLPNKINFGKNCKALFTKVSQRPAFQAAMEDEGISYRIAA